LEHRALNEKFKELMGGDMKRKRYRFISPDKRPRLFKAAFTNTRT